MPEYFSRLYLFLMFIPLIAIHEAAHAWAAKRLGDDEAEHEGRLTLNPISHIDIWGTLVLPALSTLLYHTSPLGWGRLVPFTPDVRKPRLQMVLFALAGPIASFLLAVVLVGLLAFLPPDSSWVPLVKNTAYTSAFIALSHLLIPIPPFDGWHILAAVVRLPEELLDPGSIWWLVAFFVILSFTPLCPIIENLADLSLGYVYQLFLLIR